MPDLWLTDDHFVGKLSAMGQPTRPAQPSIPQGRQMSSNPCNYMDYKGETIQWQMRSAYGCLVAGQRPWVRAYRLYAAVTKAPLQYAACGAVQVLYGYALLFDCYTVQVLL